MVSFSFVIVIDWLIVCMVIAAFLFLGRRFAAPLINGLDVVLDFARVTNV